MLLRGKHTFLFLEFLFWENGYNKKYNKQNHKNHEERKPKSLEDRAIRTIELQDM